ncbi:hypothetical protein L1887_63061 [Cichorium endivia]|nr:hypothetical protein L1887_63061 [Cichorium endivia]
MRCVNCVFAGVLADKLICVVLIACTDFGWRASKGGGMICKNVCEKKEREINFPNGTALTTITRCGVDENERMWRENVDRENVKSEWLAGKSEKNQRRIREESEKNQRRIREKINSLIIRNLNHSSNQFQWMAKKSKKKRTLERLSQLLDEFDMHNVGEAGTVKNPNKSKQMHIHRKLTENSLKTHCKLWSVDQNDCRQNGLQSRFSLLTDSLQTPSQSLSIVRANSAHCQSSATVQTLANSETA